MVTIPMAFSTALYGLQNLARVAAGEVGLFNIVRNIDRTNKIIARS